MSGVEHYRVHLTTDLADLAEEELDDVLEGLAPVHASLSVPQGVLEVTGSADAPNARRAVEIVCDELDRVLTAIGREANVEGIAARDADEDD